MARELIAGSNAPLPAPRVTVKVAWAPTRIGGREVDVSAFLLAADGRVRSDADMVFYNQPEAAGVRLSAGEGEAALALDTAAIEPTVDKLAVALTIHDAAGVTIRNAERLELTVAPADGGGEALSFRPDIAAAGETALVLGEVYRRQGEWKLRAVAQGYAGGLGPLATAYGIDVSDDGAGGAAEQAPPPAPAAPAAPESGRVSFEKRLVNLEKSDARLVDLAKKVQVSLEKRGLTRDRAKVALCLDISGSMRPLFSKGAVDRLIQRVMALGLRFDDDGQIDVFLFGSNAHEAGTLGVTDYTGAAERLLKQYPLEPATNYGKVMDLLRRHYAGQADWGRLPVYVMFVTDGGTNDRKISEKQIRDASAEPIFWKFMAIGKSPPSLFGGKKKRRALPRGFDFLEYLDDMPGRVVDNADFFSVEDPDGPSDEELYDMLMEEYPGWLDAVAAQGILKD